MGFWNIAIAFSGRQPCSNKMESRRESDIARLEQLLREVDERAEKGDDVREKQSEVKRKPTRGQNWSDDVLRTSGEIDKKRRRRQDAQHSRSTHVPATDFSRNRSVSRQTRASVHRALSPALLDPVETLDGLSSTTATAFRKNLRIHTTSCRTLLLHPVPHRAQTKPL